MRLLVVPLVALAALAGPDAGAAPRTVVYVFAHSDDEADMIARMVVDLRQGSLVHAVWVTDGGRVADPRVREQESRAVMELIGVPPAKQHFLGFPDQAAYRHLEEIRCALLALAREVGASEIVSHAYEGGNVDHDTTSLVATLVARALGAKHYEFPDNNILNGKLRIFEFLPREDRAIRFTPLSHGLYELKMRVLHMYPSQRFGLWYYRWRLDKRRLREQGEPYREAPDYDYTQLPARELRYSATSGGRVTGELWLAAVREFLGREAWLCGPPPRG